MRLSLVLVYMLMLHLHCIPNTLWITLARCPHDITIFYLHEDFYKLKSGSACLKNRLHSLSTAANVDITAGNTVNVVLRERLNSTVYILLHCVCS